MLSCQRDAFSIPDDVHFLNCSYMSPFSKRVEAAGQVGLARKRLPYLVTPDDFFSEALRARELFATLIGVSDPTRIAIVPSASYGLAVVARNTALRPGRRVVIAFEQFPSNVYAWRALCQRSGATLVTIDPPADSAGRGRDWNARLLEALTADTALVALPHVHWTDGTRFDLEAIGARAREVGAALAIDGTQSLGALPFDQGRIGADAVVGAAYKWLMGPYSLGFAYFGPRYDGGEPIEETWAGRLGSEDFRTLVNYQDAYQPGALRYDMGERANLQLMPMGVAALEQILEWQPARIQAYCATLTAPLVAEARSLGFTVEDEAYRAAHIVGLRAPAGVDLADVATRLKANRVHVSLRGSAIRVSPHVYNDRRNVDALVDVLAEVRAGSAGGRAAVRA
ncbi:MAG: aminotransferase class V-fold PLP-dependent enzyme [Vicinamibacterales bacterium]